MFSNPGTFEEAIKNGTYDQWVQILNNPRYQMQQMKRQAGRRILAGAGSKAAGVLSDGLRSGGQPLQGDWSMDMGSGAKVGAAQYPAEFSYSTESAYCDSDPTPDFVVYNTGLAGSATQASIVAYDNLYSGCTGSNPLIYWQYSTINGRRIPTSVVPSGDGSQVAFVQHTSGGVASLVILKWAARNPTLVTLTNTGAAGYRACSAPCMVAITLIGSPDSTKSAPFYDYGNDLLYVGDDSGVLHKFQNIFISGKPSEVTTGGWPLTLDVGNKLTSPVYDQTSGNIFVGSSGGTLYRVVATSGASTASGILAAGTGIVDSPVVDSTAARVYTFVGDDGSTKCTASSPCSAVYQLTTTFASGNTGTEQTIGRGNAADIGYAGNFDNVYFTSDDPPSGDLYVCGSETGTARRPTLWQVPITSNVMGTPTKGPELVTNTATDCSPVAEFFNSPTDWLFLSVTGNALTTSPISCPSNASGCIMSFDVTSESGFGASKTTSGFASETGGTSGIVVDNSLSSPTGTSNVYFSTLGNQACAGNGSVGDGTGGCAIQAPQNGLN
ncbi:MAG: hypothetical protein ABSG11_22045 [Candidatus Korobacteraceae bacterium]